SHVRAVDARAVSIGPAGARPQQPAPGRSEELSSSSGRARRAHGHPCRLADQQSALGLTRLCRKLNPRGCSATERGGISFCALTSACPRSESGVLLLRSDAEGRHVEDWSVLTV